MPSEPTDTTQVAAVVSADLAEKLKAKAIESERSVAGEIRAALKAWVDRDEKAAA